MDTRYYTVTETANLLRVSVSTVRRAVAGGHLATIRVGSRRQIRIGSSTLDAYLLSSSIRNNGGPHPSASRFAYNTRQRRGEAIVSENRAEDFRGKVPSGKSWRVLHADVLAGLHELESASVNCIVTSPPYYWQRDYEVEGQIGHEPTINGYIDALVDTFTAAKRVMADDGLLFLNLGDTYYSAKGRAHGEDKKHAGRQISRNVLRAVDGPGLGLPRKSLIGIPWRAALALQKVGWTLRSAIIWHRPGSIPEANSLDRPWRSYEHIFMFAKQPKYWFNRGELGLEEDVWQLNSRPENPGSHFAPYPVELVDRCLAIGCKPDGTVLDPFVGSGTTMIAALRRGLGAVGIDLKRKYCNFTVQRITNEFSSTQLQFDEQRRA